MRTAILVTLLLATSKPSVAQEVTRSNDVVIIPTGGEYVSYPAAAVSKRDEATVYAVDMSKTIDADDLEILPMLNLTWTRTDAGHEICFEHNDQKRCRTLASAWNVLVEQRFQPTKASMWPTVYVRFKDKAGETSLIRYSDGQILTGDEAFEDLRNNVSSGN